MLLQPNEEDLEWAVAQDSGKCLYVRTIQREHPDATFVYVTKEVVSYTENGHRYYHDTPQEMIDNVIKPLDEGRRKDIKLDPIVLGEPTVKDTRKNQTRKDVLAKRSKTRVRSAKASRGGKPQEFHKKNRFTLKNQE